VVKNGRDRLSKTSSEEVSSDEQKAALKSGL